MTYLHPLIDSSSTYKVTNKRMVFKTLVQEKREINPQSATLTELFSHYIRYTT